MDITSGCIRPDVSSLNIALTGPSCLQGSYGTVRACTHVASGKQYAVKILSKRKAGEERTDVIMREVGKSKQPAAEGIAGCREGYGKNEKNTILSCSLQDNMQLVDGLQEQAGACRIQRVGCRTPAEPERCYSVCRVAVLCSPGGNTVYAEWQSLVVLEVIKKWLAVECVCYASHSQ